MWHTGIHESPIFLRSLTNAERQALIMATRPHNAFVLRRCQIRLASTRSAHAPHIAAQLGCNEQTVLDTLHTRTAAARQSWICPPASPLASRCYSRSDQLITHEEVSRFNWSRSTLVPIAAEGLNANLVSSVVATLANTRRSSGPHSAQETGLSVCGGAPRTGTLHSHCGALACTPITAVSRSGA